MIPIELFPREPLVVSYGVGVDSTAMLVAMRKRGIRPDAILFSDTGAEKPGTYAYLAIINAWLRKVGFPEVTVVRYAPKRAPYETLEGKCLANETLPSLAFRGHSCAIVFKHEPMDKWMGKWEPAKAAWAAGVRVKKAIGYDAGARDMKRCAKAKAAVEKKAARGDKDAKRYDYWYPLVEWGIDRIECLRIIAAAGLPVPEKSACFFCPASKKSEVIELRDSEPELFWRAIAIERRARDGKHGLKSVKGLGINWAWEDLIEVKAEEVVDDEAEMARP